MHIRVLHKEEREDGEVREISVPQTPYTVTEDTQDIGSIIETYFNETGLDIYFMNNHEILYDQELHTHPRDVAIYGIKKPITGKTVIRVQSTSSIWTIWLLELTPCASG